MEHLFCQLSLTRAPRMCPSHQGANGLRFLAEGVPDSHTQCDPLALCSLLYRDYREMSVKSSACLSEVKAWRRQCSHKLEAWFCLITISFGMWEAEY